MLRLKELKLEDSGEYRVHVTNGEQDHWENLTLIVTVRPTVAVSVLETPENGLYMYGGQYTLRYIFEIYSFIHLTQVGFSFALVVVPNELFRIRFL